MIQLDLLNHCHCIHCYAILLDIDVLTALYHASSTVMYFFEKSRNICYYKATCNQTMPLILKYLNIDKLKLSLLYILEIHNIFKASRTTY